ncbi:MAG: polyketide synthase dehydratase domain-containing protein, partial [Actinoallomurus sp.]
TYAFQRERYWVAPSAGAGDLAAAGLGRLEHPVLAAAVQVGDRDEWVFTGRLSQDGQPWTQDHVVLGMVIVPGVALVELAVAAGGRTASPVVEELVLEAPLVLPDEGAVQVQVTVAQADEDGRREVAIYSRPESADDGESEATCHARGVLVAETEPLAPFPATWPPSGAEPVAVDALYETLAEVGYDYGPLFQGVQAAWRDGADVYTEVALPDDAGGEGFGVHPALFDAALHGGLMDKEAGSPADLPFSWSGVRLGHGDASRARVRIRPAGESALRLDIAGEHGEPIASVEKLVFRQVEQAQLAGARQSGPSALFQVGWTEVTAAAGTEAARVVVLGELTAPGERHADLDALERALTDGTPAPEVVIAAIQTAESAGEAPAAREVAASTLGLVQRWLASERLADARLVVVTRNGIAVGDETPDLAQAPVWGLVRSAQSEHPERFTLVDLDDTGGATEWGSLIAGHEPQLAVRAGQVLAPRLKRTDSTPTPDSAPLDPDGTVLITGGTGGLGALFAKHLAGRHGAKHLLLLSRRGPDAAGVPELV